MQRFKLFKAVCMAVLALAARPSLADCDADFVNALRTQYDEATGSNLADQLFELACNKSVSSKATNASGNAIGYGDASFGENAQTINEACRTKDKKYFEKKFKADC